METNMPKATLTFNLPEDTSDHLLAINASNLNNVLWDLDQHYRNESKYQGKETVSIDSVRDKIRELMNDYNINFEMFM